MSPKPNRIAPNVVGIRSNGKRYYYYKMPDGSREPLGNDIIVAREAANALNMALRDSGDVVQKILSGKTKNQLHDPRNPLMVEVIDEYRKDYLANLLSGGQISARTHKDKSQILAEYEQTLHDKKCKEVETFDLAHHLKERTGNVQRKHAALLKSLFDFAISSGYRDINPANSLQPKHAEKRLRRRHTWEGFNTIRDCAPAWLKVAMDIALGSLQRRSDLVALHRKHIDRSNKTIEILQQKTRNYAKPVYISIVAGEYLWTAIEASFSSDIPCPYVIHCRPKRITKQSRDAKDHPFQVLPEYLTRQFKKYRDKSGAYDHIPMAERPTLHDLRALGILMYFKAGFPMDYIMALAGHARQSTTEHYLDGHEQKLPVAVSADLAINNVDLDNISWDLSLLPPELVKLIDEPDDA